MRAASTRCAPANSGSSSGEAGARLFPSGHFGANAAWYRLAVSALNLYVAMAHLGLPEERRGDRLSTARFRFLNRAGRVIRHARRYIVVLSTLAASLVTSSEAIPRPHSGCFRLRRRDAALRVVDDIPSHIASSAPGTHAVGGLAPPRSDSPTERASGQFRIEVREAFAALTG
jgi:hypothetical protein